MVRGRDAADKDREASSSPPCWAGRTITVQERPRRKAWGEVGRPGKSAMRACPAEKPARLINLGPSRPIDSGSLAGLQNPKNFGKNHAGGLSYTIRGVIVAKSWSTEVCGNAPEPLSATIVAFHRFHCYERARSWGAFLRFLKWAKQTDRATSTPRRNKVGASPYHRRLLCEVLELRALLSVGLAGGTTQQQTLADLPVGRNRPSRRPSARISRPIMRHPAPRA